jgi:hypothetical protein
MANTYTLIEAKTLSAPAASVTFTSIPGTYTDLLLSTSIRASSGGTISAGLRFNGSTTNYSERLLYGNGSSAASANATTTSIQWANLGNDTNTSNTFSNCQIYIPNYAGSTNKSVSTESVTENNATGADIYADAGLWSDTAAITSLTLTASTPDFATNSTFYLYGISNS